jgi:hypothetical protein
MQIATGTVVNGQIVLEDATLPEGARVTVMVGEAEKGFTLSAVEEDALLESIAEIERGECVTLEKLRATLSGRTT